METILTAEHPPTTAIVGGAPGSSKSPDSCFSRKRQKQNLHQDPSRYDDEEEEQPRVGPERTVRFAERASVRLIENVPGEWTSQEREALWYSRNDVLRQKRRCRQLAETMGFYSDEDLFDRFGIASTLRRRQTAARMREAASCAHKLLLVDHEIRHHHQGDTVDDTDDDDSSSSSSSSSSSHDSEECQNDGDDLKDIMATYSRLSMDSADLARGRASRIENQVRSQNWRLERTIHWI